MTQEEQNDKLGQLIAKCWTDSAFKQRLMAEPVAVLNEAGLSVPAGMTVNVLENNDKVLNLVIPHKPSDDLSDEDLDQVAGGFWLIGGAILAVNIAYTIYRAVDD